MLVPVRKVAWGRQASVDLLLITCCTILAATIAAACQAPTAPAAKPESLHLVRPLVAEPSGKLAPRRAVDSSAAPDSTPPDSATKSQGDRSIWW